MKDVSPSNAVEKSRGMTANSQGIALIDENLLKSKVYTIRGVKVMLDADLAEIYGYSTKDFNRQVKNNIERFPEIFRFQLTKEETLLCSRCKNSTLNKSSSGRGSNIKYLPYAFTEQGIYMLMTVLKGELAIKQSIAIMLLFKDMKDYIASENQQLLGCANCAQIAALTAQNTREISVMRSDYEVLKAKSQKLEDESRENRDSLAKIMENFTDPSTFKHFLILNGQKLEADVAFTQISKRRGPMRILSGSPPEANSTTVISSWITEPTAKKCSTAAPRVRMPAEGSPPSWKSKIRRCTGR